MGLVFNLEILVMMPVTDIIEYPSEFDDNYIENKLFKQIREFLDIDIDVLRIMEHIGYDRGRRGNPAISIYYPTNSFEKFILLDTYIGATDQLDLIYIGFCSSCEDGGQLRKLVRKFYDETCNYNIYYCEGTNPIGFKYRDDFRQFEKLSKERSFKTIEGKKFLFYRGTELLLEINC